jgi:TRAP-type C4-dicarboxylate transport system substrate-binding protein
VAPHITRTNEYPQDVVITINEKRYQSLGPDLQKVLREAAFEAGEQATQMTYESVDRDSEKVKKGGGKYYEINLKPFADKMEPYHKELESKGFISRGIVDKIRATPTK